jgi:hypothetical protein
MTEATRERDASHPSFRRLLDIVDELHSDPRVRAASAHVDAGCERCATEIDAIAVVRDALAAGPLLAPPRAVVRRASGLLARQRVRRGVEAVQRVLATLVLDGRMAAAPLLRSGGDGRRLLWNVGGMELFATVVGGRSGATLRAQLLPDDPATPAPTGRVRVLCDGKVAARAQLDSDGEFVADGLRAGTYVIEGECGSVAFSTPPFVVGA